MGEVYRPPLDMERIKMLIEIQNFLNENALFPLTLHDVLNMCIDRAYIKTFPDRKVRAKRKKYITIDF